MNKDIPYYKLALRIRGSGLTQAAVAAIMGISPSGLHGKLRGTIPWSLAEVYRLGAILSIPTEELLDYFPKPKGA